MAPKGKGNIIIAAIGAFASIIVAIVTTMGTISVSKPEALEVRRELDQISDFQRIKNLPIGTIISSMLPPALFSDQVKDVSPFDPKKSNWVLADGETDITVSRYGKLLGNVRYPPNLRGMFLRGMNEGRNDGNQDPDKNRKAGEFQSDEFKEHAHKIVNYLPSSISWREFQKSGDQRNFKPVHITVGPYTDVNEAKDVEVAAKGNKDETRPKNVAVYFYLKIN